MNDGSVRMGCKSSRKSNDVLRAAHENQKKRNQVSSFHFFYKLDFFANLVLAP
jgi:hypothetical protein